MTLATLTPRERQVLDLIVEGRKNAEIANLLGLSHFTITNYVHSLLHKLGAQDRTQAAVIAVTGLYPPWDVAIVDPEPVYHCVVCGIDWKESHLQPNPPYDPRDECPICGRAVVRREETA